MPETDQSATDFVIEGDTTLLAAAAGSHCGRSHRRRRPHGPRLHGAARRRRPRCAGARAGADPGPGLQDHRAGQPGQQLLGRLAHAPATGARADVPVRPAAAGRAHQPPGPGRAGLAGSLAQALRRHDAGDQPRPRVSGCRDQRHAAHRRGQADALRRQLQQVRGHARRADGAAAERLLQAAGQDCPPAEVHRPLQGQGQQGQAGAKPGQGAGPHGKDRAAAGRGRLHLRIQGARQPAQPDAVA